MQSAEPARAPHITSSRAEKAGFSYLCAWLLIPLLGVLFPFFAERYAPLSRLAVSYSGSILDHGHGLAGVNADVVFFGDSTVMYGIDAARMSRELGLKVIDIPNNFGALVGTGDWALREYLAANKPPKLIVFQGNPWTMDFYGLPNTAPYESDEQMIRHAPPGDFVRFAARHPREMMLFPFRFWLTPSQLNSFYIWWVLGIAPVELRPPVLQGYSPYIITKSLQPGCVFPGFTLWQSTRSTQDLLAKYRSPQTMTMAYLAPIANCQGAKEIASRHYPGLSVLPPTILPADHMADDSRFGHPLAHWSSETTDLATAVVRRQLEHVPTDREARPPRTHQPAM